VNLEPILKAESRDSAKFFDVVGHQGREGKYSNLWISVVPNLDTGLLSFGHKVVSKQVQAVYEGIPSSIYRSENHVPSDPSDVNLIALEPEFLG